MIEPKLCKQLGHALVSKLLTPVILFFVSLVWAGLAVAGPSAYFQQIVPLVPKDATLKAVLPNTPESVSIDTALVQILSSKSGKSFCQATVENFDIFRRAYFINEKSARVGFDLCRGHFATRLTQKIFEKSYYIVSTQQTDFAADAWTTPHNETYLILNNGNLESPELTLILTHELTVSLDRKEQIGFMGVIDFPNLGIKDSQKACNLVSVLRNTNVKHLLSAVRAFDVESTIAADLNLATPEGFENYKNLSCTEKINFIGQFTTFLATNTQSENIFNTLMDQPNCRPQPATLNSTSEVAEYLKNLDLQFNDGTTRSACDYLTEGFPFYAGVSFRGGPRPRLGGGWKTMSSPNQQAAKQSMADALAQTKPIEGADSKVLATPPSEQILKPTNTNDMYKKSFQQNLKKQMQKEIKD